jgi:uncharacterized LabA/DUF88 family protein
MITILASSPESMAEQQPVCTSENNFAFIDTQNLLFGIQGLGWCMDFVKFRRYLREKYHVTTAYMFLGYMYAHRFRYKDLQDMGYILKFKPTTSDSEGNIKGNIDADLVLQVMIDFQAYDKALIVSSDGDFYSLVAYLKQYNKLKYVMSPHARMCSSLLKKVAAEKMLFMDYLKGKLSL